VRKLKVGDWVEVRSRDEILDTLDQNGRLDGMPFMPEMFAFCGKRFQVYKRAHKTCDTVFPVRGRRVADSVHLETRCDGSEHGGCQASCLLFWKEAWLRRVDEQQRAPQNTLVAVGPQERESLLSSVYSATQTRPRDNCASPRYTCQATQLPYATTDLKWWNISQYVEDYTSGNVGLGRIISGFVFMLYLAFSQAGIGLGKPMRWLYDRCHPLWRGTPFPRRPGRIPEGDPTPAAMLDLQPGELVRIKPFSQILETLDVNSKNRGLYFDAEEVPYCGRTYRVLRRVTKIIDEGTGMMREMKTPSIILDSVICQSRYSECRLFCPRSIYPYWREIWLERVE